MNTPLALATQRQEPLASNVVPLKVAPATPSLAPSPWILNRYIDLFMCCGGLLWLVFLLHSFAGKYLGSTSVGYVLLLTVVGTHVLSETHTAATLVRLQTSKATRRHLGSYVRYVSIICLLALAYGLANPSLTPMFAKIYFVWIAQHFLAQSYGVTLIYCHKRGYSLSIVEKRIMKLLFNIVIVYAIARQFAYREWGNDEFLGQPLPYFQLVPDWGCAILVGLVKFAALTFLAMVIAKYFKERKLIPLPSALLVVTSLSIFLVPKSVSSSLWLFVPAFFHGCQYLVVATSYHLKEQGLPDNVRFDQLGHLLVKPATLQYWGLLFMAGIFIYIGVPGLLEQFGIDVQTAVITVFCVVNFHHFMVDAAIWRLRDPQQRMLLVA